MSSKFDPGLSEREVLILVLFLTIIIIALFTAAVLQASGMLDPLVSSIFFK